MTYIQEIRLEDGESYTLPLGPSRTVLRVRCRLSDQLTPDTLLVESNAQPATEVPSFVPIALREEPGVEGRFEGRVVAAISDEDGAALLVGDREVVRVTSLSPHVQRVCCLNRRDTDDRGFYSLRMEPLSDSVLVLYEGGVARIALSGQELWHTYVHWDDIFDGCDGEYVYYWTEQGEFAPGGFAIDLRTGERSRRDPR